MNNNLNNEDLIELGKMLIAVATNKPIEYRVNGSGDPWQDYDYSKGFDLEYEIHCFRQGKRFRIKDPFFVRMQKVKEKQKKEQENRKLKQLLLMGVPIQYHQYHNWHPVKNFGHFLMLEKDSCTDFRVDTAFKKSQIYYNNKTKAPTTSPKKGDTFVGSYDTYIKWVKEHLEWEPTFMEDKTYYIRPILGCGGCGYSFEECQNKLLNVKLGQGENIVRV